MPAFAESVLFGALQLSFWGAVLVCAVAATVLAVRRHSTPDPAVRAPDPVFWDVFMGSAVALPAILIPTLASPWSGVVLAALGAGAGVAAYRGSPQILAWQDRRRQLRQDRPVHTAAQAEHEALLARWSRYELDPASSIDYPAMTDVRLPETSALIRAMREAEQLRAVPHQGYAPAVVRFGLALAAAERAAGIPAELPAVGH
ncbi:hypothetical protein AU252_09905 [Pseudarthrobacter sulfonivorans]|uniref:Uncharacterized protein n=1 Tax=Pseudarthrobacter sulfonivorans TaxID=121292 RepID=A0A0U3QW16_9MICC|nr:hypothetical protein [Pseudarthrobacter sulfonivorans]ALV43877.1 hypothetical protein AU252_09905 [Pseudarthrobacter sulfonivorans]